MTQESETVESVSGRLRPQIDVVVGLVLVLLGAYVVFESWRMPGIEHPRVRAVYEGPGFVPALLGITLGFFGVLIVIRAIREGGLHFRSTGLQLTKSIKQPEPQRLAVMLLLSLGYAWGLIGRVPFPVATFVFMVLFILVFDWGNAAIRSETNPRVASFLKRSMGIHIDWSVRRERMVLAVTATLQAVLTAWIITYIFENVFLRRLP